MGYVAVGSGNANMGSSFLFEGFVMKVGDLVKYYGSWTSVGVVLGVNKTAGTIQVLCDEKIAWWVTSGCEVINESR